MAGNILFLDGLPAEHRRHVLDMLRAYEASLPISLDFQDFEAELAAFPGEYEPPEGGIILAVTDDGLQDLLGMVCIRRLDEDCCEMKRLFVSDQARGLGLGHRLAGASMTRAKALGYHCMRLDTLATMKPAISLYRSLGFREIGNYNGNPIAGSLFFERLLGESI